MLIQSEVITRRLRHGHTTQNADTVRTSVHTCAEGVRVSKSIEARTHARVSDYNHHANTHKRWPTRIQFVYIYVHWAQANTMQTT